MKILNWMQSKLNGRQGKNKPNIFMANLHMQHEPCKEEFSDWPHELLTIGTFGNNILKEDPEKFSFQGNPSADQDNDDHVQDVTPEEEEGKLQIELDKLSSQEHVSFIGSSTVAELETLDIFLNCRSSLVLDRTSSTDVLSDDSNDTDDHLQHSTRVVLSRGKDVNLDNTKNAIGKRSVSFLLKKMFACRSGFSPASSLRDPLPEPRIEKILRAIFHKRIYPQSSGPTLSTKKYLENRQRPMAAHEDEMNEKTNDGSKWVKTDSEYIVLEI